MCVSEAVENIEFGYLGKKESFDCSGAKKYTCFVEYFNLEYAWIFLGDIFCIDEVGVNDIFLHTGSDNLFGAYVVVCRIEDNFIYTFVDDHIGTAVFTHVYLPAIRVIGRLQVYFPIGVVDVAKGFIYVLDVGPVRVNIEEILVCSRYFVPVGYEWVSGIIAVILNDGSILCPDR